MEGCLPFANPINGVTAIYYLFTVNKIEVGGEENAKRIAKQNHIEQKGLIQSGVNFNNTFRS